MEIPYTRDRSGFTSQVLGWGIVFVVEGLVVATLILVFAPTWWLKLLLAGAFLAFLAWFIGGYLMAPARTRHRLTDDDLQLRYGGTRIDIPGSRITGKALAVVAPLVAQVWLVILVLSIWHEALILPLVGNTVLATIAVASIGFVMTCISTRDIDLRQSVEGGAQAVLVEHVPNTPVRLAIVGCALALALGASAAIIVLPWLASFATVIIGCVLACTLVYRDAARTLTRTIAR